MTTPITSSASSTGSSRLAAQALRSAPDARLLELKPSTSPNRPGESTDAAQSRDRVELSDRARLNVAGRDTTDLSTRNVRTDLVQRVRAQLEAGTYETPEKLAYAVGRLSGHLDITA